MLSDSDIPKITLIASGVFRWGLNLLSISAFSKKGSSKRGLVNERLKTECLQQFTSCDKKKKNETKQKAEN